MRGKKGQYYILIAILLIGFAFTIARPNAQTKPIRDTFEELYQNYESEATIVINNAIYEEENITRNMQDFSEDFQSYAIQKSPKFGFAYVLTEEGSLTVNNLLDISINASYTSGSSTLNPKQKITIPNQEVLIKISDIEYVFERTNEPYKLRAIFRQQRDDEVKIKSI